MRFDGAELVGPIACPHETAPVAAAVAAEGGYHLACSEFDSTLHHVVLDATHGAKKLGHVTITLPEEAQYGLADEFGTPSLPVFAVPGRGPGLFSVSASR